jgi:hypothetical protein
MRVEGLRKYRPILPVTAETPVDLLSALNTATTYPASSINRKITTD